MKNRNSPEQLIGDSVETRIRQAVNVTYAVLREHSGPNSSSNIRASEKDFSAFIGRDSSGDRYLSYTLQGPQVGIEHRLDIDLPSSGEKLIVSVENSFAIRDGRFLPEQPVVTGTDALKLMDPLDLGTRGDLRDKEVGLSDPDFQEVFFKALPALNKLEDGDTVDIGGLRKNELTVAKVGDGGNLLRFVDSAGVSRLVIELSKEDGVLSKVSFTEADELPIDNGFVDYRGGTAIDSLAAKVVSKLSMPEKKTKEEKSRSSFKDKLKKLFTSATAGGYSNFGGSGSGWKSEQLNAETPQARDFRESVEYLESILKRPEVKTGLETADSIEIESGQGELGVIKTDRPSEFDENLPENGELVAVSASTDSEVCFVGRVKDEDGTEVIVIGRTMFDEGDDTELLAESLILTKEPSGQVSTTYSSNERSPSVTAYGKGKIASRVRGFLKKFF